MGKKSSYFRFYVRYSVLKNIWHKANGIDIEQLIRTHILGQTFGGFFFIKHNVLVLYNLDTREKVQEIKIILNKRL